MDAPNHISASAPGPAAARPLPELNPDERAVYDWQMPVEGFGETGQRRLKAATVLISRCGGLGGLVAYELAAAGIGHLVLAHGGVIRPSDLNRQLLMTWAGLGGSRVESAVRRLQELNPRLAVTAVPENVTEANAARLVAAADVVVDCAPLFEERLRLNREVVRQGRPMVEAAMFGLGMQLTTIIPGRTPCLRCLCPEPPATWTRRFPVFGAVSGTVGALAALEVIKLLSGCGEPLLGRMLVGDLRTMVFKTVRVKRDPACAECGGR